MPSVLSVDLFDRDLLPIDRHWHGHDPYGRASRRGALPVTLLDAINVNDLELFLIVDVRDVELVGAAGPRAVGRWMLRCCATSWLAA